MPKETMTPKERWQAVYTHRKPDRIPMDYWATPEATELLMRHSNTSSEREMLIKHHVDFVVEVKPEYIGPPLQLNTDEFGCVFRDIDYGTGIYEECIFNPLAQYNTVEEIDRDYTWPTPDWWDYGSLPSLLHGYEDYPVRGGHYEPFLIYKNLRGDQQAYIDLMMNPEMVHYCLDKLLHLGLEDITRIYEQLPGKVMMTYVAEDMGAQDDLLISPAHIHEFLLPRIKKVIDLIHSSHVFVFHHNDGAVRNIIPDMIESGIDLLNPLQWRCPGMDRVELKKEFGEKIAFHGAMDNQETLPFGTTADVEREVLENLEILGFDGSYVLAPCHNIQAVSPPENIFTMYEVGYENGWL
ncbi:uroporphyrinogen decarboxylase family protein [Acidobacteriota bacterium]